VLFVAAGLTSLVDAPFAAGGNAPVLVGLAVAGFVAAALAWRLPWERWPSTALVALPATALVLIGVASATGDSAPSAYGVFFVMVFAWIGLALPRGASLLAAPVAALAYLLPLALAGDQPSDAWTSVLVVVPASALVGEIVAAAMRELRSARAVDARRVGDLEAIVGATGLLQGDGDPADVGDLLARVATSVLHGTGAVVLFQDDDGKLQPVAAYLDRLRDIDLAAEAMASGQPVAVAGLLVAPLRGHHSVLGAMAVSYPPEVIPDSFTVHAAQLFGAQAGLAVEQLRVKEELTTAAMQDALTGVGNRRRAAALLEGLRPGDAVVLIDLDHFKLVNDTAGHATGDRVLVLLGRYLREAARGADTVARYGGEEFLLVLRHAAEGALAATERLTEGWRAMQPLTTFSAGVAVHVEGRSPAATLGRADAALYRAKRTGRDRVCADGETTVDAFDAG
jgi:diguanylate cyclase (GGDEF)-like protein